MRPLALAIALAWALAPGIGLARAEETISLDEKIAGLVKDLGNEDFETRERAEEELARIGAPAVGALERAAASDGDLEVRHRAERVLATFVHSNPDYMKSLAALGVEALPRIAAIVEKGDPAECALAAEALGTLPVQESRSLLETLLVHPGERVRARAALALARMGESQGVDALRGLAAGQEREARILALAALGELGDAASLPLLFAALPSGDPRAAQAAATGLARFFVRAGHEPELAAAFRLAPDDSTRRLVLALFSRSPSREGAAFLMAAASNDRQSEPVRAEALLVLGAADFSGVAGAEKFLAEFARHRTGTLAVLAAERIAVGSPEEGRAILDSFARSSDPAVRDAATSALERLSRQRD